MSSKITRRQALMSLATIAAGAVIAPVSVFGVEPVKQQIRFPLIGDWGTGDSDQTGPSAVTARAGDATRG